MRVADLKKEMDQCFAHVDQRFAQVDERFAQVDQRFAQVDERFARLEKKLAAEHEETRRHMDMVAESFREYVKMLADGITRNTQRLDQHETRISALERR